MKLKSIIALFILLLLAPQTAQAGPLLDSLGAASLFINYSYLALIGILIWRASLRRILLLRWAPFYMLVLHHILSQLYAHGYLTLSELNGQEYTPPFFVYTPLTAINYVVGLLYSLVLIIYTFSGGFDEPTRRTRPSRYSQADIDDFNFIRDTDNTQASYDLLSPHFDQLLIRVTGDYIHVTGEFAIHTDYPGLHFSYNIPKLDLTWDTDFSPQVLYLAIRQRAESQNLEPSSSPLSSTQDLGVHVQNLYASYNPSAVHRTPLNRPSRTTQANRAPSPPVLEMPEKAEAKVKKRKRKVFI